jgi:hypothetical protein
LLRELLSLCEALERSIGHVEQEIAHRIALLTSSSPAWRPSPASAAASWRSCLPKWDGT